MLGLSGIAGTLTDLLVIVIGFGLIIFVHELGHFAAAKWARIRVLAFAIGFGPAAVSFRKGLGWRRGSSEQEYRGRLEAAARGATSIEGAPARETISPTEYRLNWLPIGGYVRMLGQDDMDPSAVSSASDSYQSVPVWKRMVVISAGVVMNVLTAGLLFVGVFMAGLRVEPAVIGSIGAGSPADMAVASNASALGVTEVGLRPGDTVVSIDGKTPQSFSDLILATAIAAPGEKIALGIDREGVDGTLRFDIQPTKSDLTRLLDLGVTPARNTTIADFADWDEFAPRLGLAGVEPGMRLATIDGEPARGAGDLDRAARRSNGATMSLAFVDDQTGREVAIESAPRPLLRRDLVDLDGSTTVFDHLLGFAGVIMVSADAQKAEQGLEPGDVFARIGGVEFPSLIEGIREIRASKGRRIQVVVLRGEGPLLARDRVTLDVDVSREGLIGFAPDETTRSSAVAALAPGRVIDPKTKEARQTAASRVIDMPGSRVVSVGGVPVSNFEDVRAALLDQTREAYESGASDAQVTLTLELPRASRETVEREWTLTRADLERLHDLGWGSGVLAQVFEPRMTVLKASGPVEAVRMGVHETNRVMLTTYLTFARLAQGTVKVEHLKGPVGIAHMGTIIADRGFIWVLFFMGLISVNLAVINFLPLPIVDGGQFLMLCYEGLRGRPVPIPVQNAVTMAGLVLIGSMFLIVTFNDVRALFGV